MEPWVTNSSQNRRPLKIPSLLTSKTNAQPSRNPRILFCSVLLLRALAMNYVSSLVAQGREVGELRLRDGSLLSWSVPTAPLLSSLLGNLRSHLSDSHRTSHAVYLLGSLPGNQSREETHLVISSFVPAALPAKFQTSHMNLVC